MMVRLGILSLLLIGIVSAEMRSSEYLCADNYAEIKCPDDSKIVIERIVNKYKPYECAEFSPNLESLVENRFETCLGIVRNDQSASIACNGEQVCHFKIKQYNFKTDINEANCNFTSNYAKIYYSCIPNFETQKYAVNSYDICDNYAPTILENVDRAFIHSPYYPNYYLNNRNCYIGIKIPNGKRLVVYLMRRSMEDKSVFRNLPKDYVGIEDGLKFYGFSNIPEIIYNGNDKNELYVRFVSDWITTQHLRNPKGFLIFFELFPIHQPVTTQPLVSTTEIATTTTSTTKPALISTTTTIKTTSKEVKIQEKKMIPDTISERMDGHHFIKKEEDRLMTIITLLIGIIGILILIIFGLLFSFRKNPKQQSEEDNTIYEMNDSKSVHSGNYNDEYQNVSIISTISLNKETPCKGKNLAKKQKFNETLRKFYRNLDKTLKISKNLLQSDNFIAKEINSTSNLDKTNIYSPNDFNLNESDVKIESTDPLERLKLFKSSANLGKKQNNETEMRNDLNRSENLYVTIQPIKPNLGSTTEDGKLEIYEVNFDENFAYLTPSSKASSPSKDQDFDIYHSINDYGNDTRELLKEQMNKSSQCLSEDIYSTPSNKEVKSNEDNLADKSSDNSVINLLNHENDGTNA